MRRKKTLIVHPTSYVRSMIVDALRAGGFNDLFSVASGAEVLHLLQHQKIEWIITVFDMGDSINVLNMLDLVKAQAKLRHISVSMLYDPDLEGDYLSLAFALGLYSSHMNNFVKEDIQSSFEELFALEEMHESESSLVSTHYLREHLIAQKKFDEVFRLDQNLLAIFPGSNKVLINLTESYLYTGKKLDAVQLADQIQLIDKHAGFAAQMVLKKHAISSSEGQTASAKKENILKITSAVVVDPDTDNLFRIKNLLSQAGVRLIETFDSSLNAIEWMSINQPPKLFICEWRIPDLAGPYLIQRLRRMRHFDGVIVVCSSLVRTEELSLLKEIGVDAVLEKPFGNQVFFKTLINTKQQNARPRDQSALSARILRSIDIGRLEEAERLMAYVMADPSIEEVFKTELQAELDFGFQRFDEAKKKALSVAAIQPDSISILNLLGKISLLKNDFEAALKFFQKAHSKSPKNIDRLIAMSQAELNRNNFAGSAVYVEKAISLDPTNEELLAQKAMVSVLSGDLTTSKSILSGIEKGERFVSAMNARAIAFVRIGRFDDGFKIYMDALECMPKSWKGKIASVQYNLGLGYARSGDLGAALTWLEDAMMSHKKSIAQKAASLHARIQKSLSQGSKLVLSDASSGDDFDSLEVEYSDESTPEWKESFTKPQTDTEIRSWLEKMEIGRGDYNCYLIYPIIDQELKKHQPFLLPVIHLKVS